MRWLAGWSGGVAGSRNLTRRRFAPDPARAATRAPRQPLAPPAGPGASTVPSAPTAHDALAALAAVRPLAATTLWDGPDPLWAVGDWRPEEIRQAVLRPGAAPEVSTGPATLDLREDGEAVLRLAVLGHCGADDEELAAGLAAARGGAVRHLTAWPGSYTVLLRIGTRSTLLLGDLAGAQPLFHTPWCGGTAYATAGLPLADLIGAPVDTGHLAARLACPESPEALGTGTPYVGVRRVPPGHTLAIRGGRPHVTAYDDEGAPGTGPGAGGEAPAVRELTRSLLEAVRSRVRSSPAEPGPGPLRPRIGADLSYGTASTTVALLAAAVPIGRAAASAEPRTAPSGGAALPAPRNGAVKGSWARPADADVPPPEPELLAAVTYREAAPAEPATVVGAVAARTPRLRHTVLAATPQTLPYADLDDPLAGPLTDEPGRSLVSAAAVAARLAAGGADHLTGYGARQALDGHPARLADLIRDGRPRELLPPVAALAGADRALAGTLTGAVRTPVTVLRAARRLARAGYAEALDDVAVQLSARRGPLRPGARTGARSGVQLTAGAYSAADLAWCVPGPAARWLSDDALSAVALRLRIAARGPEPEQHPGVRRARLALHHHAAGFRTLLQAAEQHGQRLHAPFLDNRVLRATRLLPIDVRLQPGARHALLRAVLAGAGRADLPADWGRVARPDRAAAARAGLRLAADPLTELFREPLLAEAGLIDLPAVRQALTRAADPHAELPPGTLDGLADLVSTELWLRRLQARRHGSCWTGLPLPERRAVAAARFA
ncbi:hypothetical protein P3T37_005737 [Kitasatospora sp. MAA4]|uniref:asparagine synthase-related protein n=1 Tax=Kitasatospora sp. MAA4 TaxID=3035093 RepID=UPI0024740799|nr:asparagine synthase-related protein [Kitasatospora sp. MAA4]MDH6136317.1 hypothetical protein [Kitasatospora sp. MAA4]